MADKYSSVVELKNLMGPARNIANLLEQAKQHAGRSAKRWAFELIQNCHDSTPDGALARLRIFRETVGTVDFLVFENLSGLPFRLEDLANVVQPMSDKREDDRVEVKVGQFGTGLVSVGIVSLEVGLVFSDESKGLLSGRVSPGRVTSFSLHPLAV